MATFSLHRQPIMGVNWNSWVEMFAGSAQWGVFRKLSVQHFSTFFFFGFQTPCVMGPGPSIYMYDSLSQILFTRAFYAFIILLLLLHRHLLLLLLLLIIIIMSTRISKNLDQVLNQPEFTKHEEPFTDVLGLCQNNFNDHQIVWE